MALGSSVAEGPRVGDNRDDGRSFRAGAHASMAGPYVILGFPSASALDVVLADNPSGSMWLERAPEVEVYTELWNDARTKALSPVESLEFINSIKEHGI